MPSLVGYSLRQAKAELASHGLNTGKLHYVPDIATNNVLEQYHKGHPIEPGMLLDIYSSIDLKLGLSPNSEPAYVPMLKGKSLETALDILSDHSLNIGVGQIRCNRIDGGRYVGCPSFNQNPPFSLKPEWPLGTAVHLVLTINPDLLIPDVHEN